MGTNGVPQWWAQFTRACFMLIIGLALLGALLLTAKWTFGIIGGIWYGH